MDKFEKDFLEDNKNLIKAKNYATLYSNALTVSNSFVASLTDILLAAGINPLLYVDSVPDHYALFGKLLPNFSKLDVISLPDNITKIGKQAFFDCPNIKSLELNNVSNIDYAACAGIGITTIDLSNVDLLAQCAFLACSNLTLVKGLHALVIRSSCFDTCHLLKDVELQPGIQVIMNRAFYSCGMRKVIIPDGCYRIDNNAFEDCYYLKEVVLPDSVVDLGIKAFPDRKSLTIKCSKKLKGLVSNRYEKANIEVI